MFLRTFSSQWPILSPRKILLFHPELPWITNAYGNSLIEQISQHYFTCWLFKVEVCTSFLIKRIGTSLSPQIWKANCEQTAVIPSTGSHDNCIVWLEKIRHKAQAVTYRSGDIMGQNMRETRKRTLWKKITWIIKNHCKSQHVFQELQYN
jgi:hypothetical protein